MPGHIRLIVLLAIFGTFCTRISPACQYNVRETGFVDLGTERYFLFCYVSRNTPRDLVAAFEKDLRDSCVVAEVIDIDRQPDHPALKYLDRPQAAHLPQLVLVSPIEQAGALPLKAGPLREVVDSPLRQTIVDHLAKTYGVVLLIEGADAEANGKAAKAAAGAIKSLEQQMKFMPKPVARGPVLVTLKQDAFSREPILLWSLGIREKTLREPRAAVLYGRARWIGPLLEGDQITEALLLNILSVIGADCQCGIDPKLIRGTALPVRWHSKAQAAVAADLGFDPENPIVIGEVSQIMKLQASLYPWTLGAPPQKAAAADGFPIPFVEDRARRKPAAPAPFPSSLLYAVVAAAGLVLIAGIVVGVRAIRKKS